ncbi:MAG: GNAT family N-acetyltransferase [Clostridia bacterium]|nr:GNAT family N-acetyltransferase [Clostridia bacterium]
MIEGYICKIATIEEMEQNWNYLIEIHPGDNAWQKYKEKAIRDMQNGNAIVYYGLLNGVIISEATAILSNIEAQNSDGLVDNTTVYLSAFRTRKECQGKGYFSELYKFMENDLKNKGYKKLTLGVEPCEVKNMMIYFKYGFTEFIKNAYEIEPPKNENEEPTKYLVSYYAKNLEEKTMKNNKVNGKIIAICGKIASGKSYYANQIKEKENAIILNTDELTYAMFDNEQGEKYTELANRANEYLLKKAVELIKIGCNVIIDWGFWRKYNRGYINEYFKNEDIIVEWHYINIDDLSWQKNIEERNNNIEAGLNKSDFYVTEGLKKKLLDNWEEPSRKEIDVWHDFKRQ